MRNPIGLNGVLILCTTLLILTNISCRKAADPATPVEHGLKIGTGYTLRMNQAAMIYDTTVLDVADSSFVFSPPNARLYEWILSPDSNTVAVNSNYGSGFSRLVFNRSGNYQVMANIYDSSSHTFLAHTNTITIVVKSDTLYRSQAIRPDDELIMTQDSSDNDGADLSLNLQTVASYEYGATLYGYFDNTVPGYSFVIADSMYVLSYPFAYGYGPSGIVKYSIGMGRYTLGIPQRLSITWLNKTYSGMVTMTGNKKFKIDWDNSGAVKINE